MSIINVYSEIGKLKTVLLHRPGKELENLTPAMLERLLFDDIPYLKVAQEEHDAFAETLRNNGIKILYLEDLAADSLVSEEIRENFINEFLQECNVHSKRIRKTLKDYFEDLSNRELVLKLMSGVRVRDLTNYNPGGLQDLVSSHYPFILDPLPNLYFTRDPFATIGNGVTINAMRTATRRKETLFAKYIFQYNPDFTQENIPVWYNRTGIASIEGGDELVLNKEILAVGISQRTDAYAIEMLAQKLLGNSTFKTVLAFEIPSSRAFMHLDTVFTMIDYDKFTIHPEIEGPLKVYAISRQGGDEESGDSYFHDDDHGLDIRQEEMSLSDVLKKYLKLDDVTLIRCAGGDIIDAPREQWNDGSNTLAIAPGEVIVYDRNYVTNQLLVDNGIKIHQIPSSELARGRGGPRCMSMPIFREDLTR